MPHRIMAELSHNVQDLFHSIETAMQHFSPAGSEHLPPALSTHHMLSSVTPPLSVSLFIRPKPNAIILQDSSCKTLPPFFHYFQFIVYVYTHTHTECTKLVAHKIFKHFPSLLLDTYEVLFESVAYSPQRRVEFEKTYHFQQSICSLTN